MLMNFIDKARKSGITLPNVISWLCLETGRIWGAFSGTMRFRIKAHLLGIDTGPNIRVHGKVGLLRWPGGSISIGANVSLVSGWRRATAAALAFPVRLRVFGPGASITIGEGSELSGTSITARSCAIIIGRKVLIGPNSIITDSDFHAHWPPEARAASPGYEKDAPVKIGDYAWIGMNCVILKGCSIGSGAIVGAGSVITSDVPENCVACGNPARIVRKMS